MLDPSGSSPVTYSILNLAWSSSLLVLLLWRTALLGSRFVSGSHFFLFPLKRPPFFKVQFLKKSYTISIQSWRGLLSKSLNLFVLLMKVSGIQDLSSDDDSLAREFHRSFYAVFKGSVCFLLESCIEVLGMLLELLHCHLQLFNPVGHLFIAVLTVGILQSFDRFIHICVNRLDLHQLESEFLNLLLRLLDLLVDTASIEVLRLRVTVFLSLMNWWHFERSMVLLKIF